MILGKSMTLRQYLLKNADEHFVQSGLLTLVVDIATIGRHLARDISRAAIMDMRGSTGKHNVQNEIMQRLDWHAHQKFLYDLSFNEYVAAIASEEAADVQPLKPDSHDAPFVVALDPLDGSSNIDVNVSIGTIFSIHQRIMGEPLNSHAHFLQKGSTQVCAGYVLYGTSTLLVLSWGDGVFEFTYDPQHHEYYPTRQRMLVPKTCRYYSVNESNIQRMQPRDILFIEQARKTASTRYIGSLVADFHRNLIEGGVFMYPAIDKAGDGTFCGKLRLNLEAKPLAFVLKNAGGVSVDGERDILDITPSALHQRVPLIMGNIEEITHYMAL